MRFICDVGKGAILNLTKIDNFNRKKVLAYVLVGGSGQRLRPLTSNCAKPSVAFGLDNRIVDFVISNLINSGIIHIYLVAQYKPDSLLTHVRMRWEEKVERLNGFVRVICPDDSIPNGQFEGTADAIFKNLDKVNKHQPELVAIFSADHIYRMDVRSMVNDHLEYNSDVSISAISVPIARASSFGVLSVDSGGQVMDFNEKPSNPVPIPGDPTLAHTSMGNYIFNTNILMEVAKEARLRGDLDFGHDIIGWLIKKYTVHAYNFCNNKIPGVQEFEDSTYWYDVGTIESYWQSHQDMLGDVPILDLDNPLWPIGGLNKSGRKAFDNSFVSFDTQADNAIIRNSIIRGHVMLGQGVVIEDSIILGDVIIKKGAHIKRAIVDRRNVIAENERIGHNLLTDRQKYYVDSSGIVVVAAGKLKELSRAKYTDLQNFIVPAMESSYVY